MDNIETILNKEVINAAGFMTSLGSSRVREEAIDAIQEILPCFIKINDLQKEASKIIARVTGSEAGWVTASAASGVAAAVAACMTGEDISKIENLPDTSELKNEVVIQNGHDVRAGGALISTLIKLSGAKPTYFGFSNESCNYQLETVISENTAAILYVINPRITKDLLPLEVILKTANKYDVPVIIDAAAEYDLKGFIEAGADLVVYSGHKFLRGPTSGLVTGKEKLIQACKLQERGICRAMKVGKEGIFGLMAALEAHEKDDKSLIREEEEKVVDYWVSKLKNLPGVHCKKADDKWGNPVTRVKLNIVPEESGITAYHLSEELKKGRPEIRVRDYTARTSHSIELEPCPLKNKDREAEIVTERITQIINMAHKEMNPEKMTIPVEEWS